MPADKLTIESFLQKASEFPVLDVRSPSEYTHAHIPGAHSFPLFSDDERRRVGTAYHQEGRAPAIKIGFDLFGPKMKDFVEKADALGSRTFLVHCWRGGMRSGAIAWLLDFYGFRVYTLADGYKAFRRWVLTQFETPVQLRVLGGYTGSGKTRRLRESGEPFLDLENLAGHKGSAFGGIGLPPQPRQEMFENLLAMELARLSSTGPIWVEDESRRIGSIHIPEALYTQMHLAALHVLEVPFEKRLDNILEEYGSAPGEALEMSIRKIEKRLGGLECKTALTALHEGRIRDCFSILLVYYDKYYQKAMKERPVKQYT